MEQRKCTKIFKARQIKEIDALTIEYEAISSYDLLKHAVRNLEKEILPLIGREKKIIIFAGPGNNGGDALTLAKTLSYLQSNLIIYLCKYGHSLSVDCQIALTDIQETNIKISIDANPSKITLTPKDLIIDGLFGSGLTRPLKDEYAQIANHINQSGAEVYSIDIPSGLQGEETATENETIIIANKTFCFQQPKMAFFFSENEKYIGETHIIDLQTPCEVLEKIKTNYYLTTQKSINIKERAKFSHKGSFGHPLLIAGKRGMAGAAILSSKACIKTGCGLLTVHIPEDLNNILQISNPEAILDLDENPQCFSNIKDIIKYSAVGIGPGIGISAATLNGFKKILQETHSPMVIDADAINLLSQNKELISLIPVGSILTPHPKEFDRLIGSSANSKERFDKADQFAIETKLIIVLKGANSSIHLPNGEVYINSTGNSGMSTAGSGDVLTGIILSLLAQKYNPEDAAIIGVYLHGLAGDLALNEDSEESLIASDIISHIGKAFKMLKKETTN